MQYLVAAFTVSVLAVVPAVGAQAKAELKSADGRSVGTVTFTDSPHGVLIHAALTGLPPGTHAIHIHEAGKCEPPFTTAGGHFNPAQRAHGILNGAGQHAGDLPNIEVPADGKITFDAVAPGATAQSLNNSVIREGGTAVIIHAGADDYMNGPQGAGSTRIACGVITRGG
jgi:Cu-Zn family superoxide dismutase